MERVKIFDLTTRKFKTITLRGDKLCVGSEYMEYIIGTTIGKCFPITSVTTAQIYKIAMPTGDGLITVGYILPDTVRMVESQYVLFSFNSVKVVTVYFDTRTGQKGIVRDGEFLPLTNDTNLPCMDVGLSKLCVGVGDIVKADSGAKLVVFTTPDLYARWLRAVVSQAPPQDLLIPLRAITSLIEDYEMTIAKLREQITTMYTDTATVFEAIINQHLRQHQAILKAVQTGQQQQPQR